VLFLNANINYDISKIVSTCYCNLRKIKKTPETLDFTGFSGGVFGVPKGIRTPDLSLRSMAYHVIHGSDVTSNIIPYAE
jgi:hypothetical protein